MLDAYEIKTNYLQKAKTLYFQNTETITKAIKNKPELSGLLANIKASILDNIEYESFREDSDSENLLYAVTAINEGYECVRAIAKLYHTQEKQTEEMIYFKFIRDTISHPNKLDNPNYQKEPYKKYTKYTFIGVGNIISTTKYFGIETICNRLFSKEEKEFAVYYNTPNGYVHLICPYSKLWKCVYDLIEQLIDILKQGENQ